MKLENKVTQRETHWLWVRLQQGLAIQSQNTHTLCGPHNTMQIQFCGQYWLFCFECALRSKGLLASQCSEQLQLLGWGGVTVNSSHRHHSLFRHKMNEWFIFVIIGSCRPRLCRKMPSRRLLPLSKRGVLKPTPHHGSKQRAEPFTHTCCSGSFCINSTFSED